MRILRTPSKSKEIHENLKKSIRILNNHIIARLATLVCKLDAYYIKSDGCLNKNALPVSMYCQVRKGGLVAIDAWR